VKMFDIWISRDCYNCGLWYVWIDRRQF
jgi:hypothetical protein